MSEFKVYNLWPVPIYENFIPVDQQCFSSIDLLDFERMKSGNGNITVDRNVLLRPEFFDLKSKIEEHCKLYTKNLLSISDRTSFYIHNSWINIHAPGDWAQAHRHVNSLISGCYYLKTPTDSGQIRFLKNSGNTNLFSFSTAFDYDTTNYITSETWDITPTEGMILLFPSHLMHEVDTNNSKENRYSLAFNLYSKGSFGYDECYLELR
jgi:uncharacterized protein (TIGR02466 family)